MRRELFATIFSDLFLVSLFLYFLIVLVEQYIPGIVSRAVPPAYILWMCFISGTIAVLTSPPQSEDTKQSWSAYIYCGIISLMTGVIIWQVLALQSSWSVLFGIAGGFIVFLASFATMRSGSPGPKGRAG